MFQSKYSINIDQIDHIMKNIIQEYWGTKTKDKVKLYQSTFLRYNSFEQTLFMGTPVIGADMKQIETPNEGSLNHWVGVIMNITFQTHYDIQYLIMLLSGYRNSPTEPAIIALKHGMEYLMHHPHELIMYSRKKFIELKRFPINVTSKQEI